MWVAVEPLGPLQAGAARPYVGWHRWAWAVDGAALLAGAAGRVVVAWAGLKSEAPEDVSPRAVDGCCGLTRARATSERAQRLATVWRLGWYSAALVLLSTALWAAYPLLRGAPWLTLSRAALVASAVLQFASGAWWAAQRALRPRAPVTPREWTGLVFAAMAAWDLLGELAIPEAMASRWWIAVVGNWIGALLLCAAQVWGLWGTRRRK